MGISRVKGIVRDLEEEYKHINLHTLSREQFLQVLADSMCNRAWTRESLMEMMEMKTRWACRRHSGRDTEAGRHPACWVSAC